MKKNTFKIFGLLSLITISFNIAAQTWVPKTTYGGGVRYAACSFSVGSRGYFLTGINGSTYYNDNWAYDTTTGSWIQKNNFGASARDGASATAIGGYGFVIGGKDASKFNNDVWQYTPATDSWIQKTPCPGVARYYGVAIADSANGIIYYGCGDNGNTTYLSDWWSYTPSTDTWKSLAAFAGGQRSYGAGFCLNGEIYVGTGNNNDQTDDASSDFWKYDPTSNTWTAIASVPGYPRRDASTFVVGGYAYICTGGNTTYGSLNDAYQYNAVNNSWTAIANYGGGQVAAGSGFSIGNNGYVGIGIAASGNTAQFYEYTSVSCNNWVPKTTYGGGVRYAACSFSVGSRGYFLTGINGSTYYNDNWAYDTTTGSWIQKNNFGASARDGASATAIGGYGFVIGGKDASEFNNDVWQYTPATDSWIQKTPCPGVARYYGVAIADSANGIIYYGCGDNGNTTYLSDWWSYTPSTDTWKSLAAFAGGQRSYGAGFCLNGEIYVGTGNNNDQTDDASSDFWKYDPTSNTWTAIASVPGYPRRDASTFVVGGYAYICTGGNTTYGSLNDAYQYNAVNNSWTAIANYGGGQVAAGSGFSIGNNGYVGIGTAASGNTAQFYEYLPCSLTPPACTLYADFNYKVGASKTVKYTSTSTGVSSGATYLWNAGDGKGTGDSNTFTYAYAYNGAYAVTLTVTDSGGGCSSTYTEYVTVTNAASCNMHSNFTASNISGGQVLFNSISTGITSGTKYYWNAGDGNGVGNGNTFNYTYAYNGMYAVNLFITDSSSSCSSDTSLYITITNAGACNIKPDFSYTAGPNGQINFTSTSSGTNGTTQLYWYTGDSIGYGYGNPYSYTYKNNGTYAVTLYLYNTIAGCSADTTINVTVTNANNTVNTCTLGIILTSSKSSCDTCNDGGAVVYATSGTAPYSYHWSNGSTSSAIVARPGIYTCCVTDAGGCSACANTTISDSCLYAEFTYSIKYDTTGQTDTATIYFVSISDTICSDSTRGPVKPTSIAYTWNFGDGTSQTLSGIGVRTCNHKFVPGKYDIALAINRPGSPTKSIAIKPVPVANPVSPTSIKNLTSDVSFTLYPNPSKGEVYLTYKGKKQGAEFAVMDITGRVIFIENVILNSAQPISINASGLANGMYFYNCIANGKVISTGKFIIAK